MDFVIQGLDMVEIPPMYKMTQIYDQIRSTIRRIHQKMMADYKGIDKGSSEGAKASPLQWEPRRTVPSRNGKGRYLTR